MPTTRDRILDAAAELMRTRGVARATTKEIARAAGLSEAALYKHFADKAQLILHVMTERMPGLPAVRVRPGEGGVEDNLRELSRGMLDFYQQAFPMMGSLLAEPALMAAQRDAMRQYGTGPEHPVAALAEYLRAERDLGRIAAAADPDAGAALLAGACFQQAFLRYFAEGAAASPAPDATAADLAATLARALTTP